MSEFIPEANVRAYISVIRRIKMKYISMYGPRASEWFGI